MTSRFSTVWLVPVALAPLVVWGNPLSALVIGAALSLGLNRAIVDGASRYGKLSLQTAIVLLGFNLDAMRMWQVSQDYALVVVLYVMLTLLGGVLLGRALGIDRILSRLLAAGTAICGATAIATLSPILRARPDQLALALAIVFFLNMVALLTFPLVGQWLQMTQTQFGIWSALAVHDTSSVVATAAVYGQEAAAVATTVKLGRTLWLIPLTLYFGLQAGSGGARIRIPAFIMLFILASILGSGARMMLSMPEEIYDGVQTASRALIVAALFFVGLEFTRETLGNLRGRVVVLGVLLWGAVVPVTLLIALRLG